MASKLFFKKHIKTNVLVQQQQQQPECKDEGLILFFNFLRNNILFFFLKGVEIKTPTPKPLKKNSKDSKTMLYASTPMLTVLSKDEEHQSRQLSTTRSPLKSVRDFFRNRFHFSNKTGNKNMTQSVVVENKSNETILVVDTDEK